MPKVGVDSRILWNQLPPTIPGVVRSRPTCRRARSISDGLLPLNSRLSLFSPVPLTLSSHILSLLKPSPILRTSRKSIDSGECWSETWLRNSRQRWSVIRQSAVVMANLLDLRVSDLPHGNSNAALNNTFSQWPHPTRPLVIAHGL